MKWLVDSTDYEPGTKWVEFDSQKTMTKCEYTVVSTDDREIEVIIAVDFQTTQIVVLTIEVREFKQ